MLKTLLSLLTVFSLLLCSCGKKQLLSSAKSFKVEEVKGEPEPKKESKEEQKDYFPFALFFVLQAISLN